MRLKFILSFCFLILTFSNYAQFAPAAGQSGTTAIAYDSSIIVDWALGIQVNRGFVQISDTNLTHEGSNKASFGMPEYALGPTIGGSEHVVSLGDGGTAIITFSRPIKNGEGPDFCVFENGLSDFFLELAHVEVSSNGLHYVRFPSQSLTQTEEQIGTFGALDPTKIHNLAGKYRQGFGTPFDLDDLLDSSNIDLNNINFVRIVDVVGAINPEFGTLDNVGNLINDLFPTPFFSGGFDLDAVGVIHQGELMLPDHQFSNVQIFPVPNSGNFVMKFTDPSIHLIQLLDIHGKSYPFSFSFANQGLQIQSDLNSGIYFMNYRTERGAFCTQFQIIK
jgi:hypothetical protein